MRTIVIAILLTLTVTATAFGQTITFDKESPGTSPSGFTLAVNKGYSHGRWIIERDSTAPSAPNVLVQADPENSGSRFPICVVSNFEAVDADVSVRFKARNGKKDQAAGIIWRYRDPENYYVVRANALEENVVLYKMQNGKRTDLKPFGAGAKAYGKEAKIPKNEWSTLRVLAKGNNFDVSLNGQKLFTVVDDTFTSAGKIGLWTKADSVTAFDDLTFSTVKGR
jgi:hypothetical protein